MNAQRPPALPFAPGDTWTIWIRSPLAVPAQLRIEDDTITATSNPGQLDDTVRLRLITESLDADVDRDLAEHLLAFPGVRSDQWAMGSMNGSVDVPVVEPTTVTDDQVTWQVTAELAVHHTDRVEGYFSLPAVGGVGGPVQQDCVDLTLPECTQLVIALASLQHWRFELNAEFAAAATTKRRGLQRARAVRGIVRR
ncbi:hypothetical protein JNUCC0626_49680 (plasmid) [Lentzea sp. JNUCC 0626]|uniref:hypothetical protein n=1 Tax=Lentzea sp. JNUCC 0626 TaxID=3367513 RepID=UPI00374929BB